jgi:hypothetical protein
MLRLIDRVAFRENPNDGSANALSTRVNTKNEKFACRVIRCPHEEGEDFPLGEDCPFGAFWKGK